MIYLHIPRHFTHASLTTHTHTHTNKHAHTRVMQYVHARSVNHTIWPHDRSHVHTWNKCPDDKSITIYTVYLGKPYIIHTHTFTAYSHKTTLFVLFGNIRAYCTISCARDSRVNAALKLYSYTVAYRGEFIQLSRNMKSRETHIHNMYVWTRVAFRAAWLMNNIWPT